MRTAIAYETTPHCCPNCRSWQTEQINYIQPAKTVFTCANCGKTYTSSKGLFISKDNPPIELYRLTWCYVLGEKQKPITVPSEAKIEKATEYYNESTDFQEDDFK